MRQGDRQLPLPRTGPPAQGHNPQHIDRRRLEAFAIGQGSDAEMAAQGALQQRQIAAAAGDPVELAAGQALVQLEAIGLNYIEHVKESLTVAPGATAPPAEPLFFYKPSTAALAPGGAIVKPAGLERLAPEGEMALVIGRTARRVREAQPTAARRFRKWRDELRMIDYETSHVEDADLVVAMSDVDRDSLGRRVDPSQIGRAHV